MTSTCSGWDIQYVGSGAGVGGPLEGGLTPCPGLSKRMKLSLLIDVLTLTCGHEFWVGTDGKGEVLDVSSVGGEPKVDSGQNKGSTFPC